MTRFNVKRSDIKDMTIHKKDIVQITLDNGWLWGEIKKIGLFSLQIENSVSISKVYFRDIKLIKTIRSNRAT